MMATNESILVHTTYPRFYTYVFEQGYFACILNKWLNTSYIFKHCRCGDNKKKNASLWVYTATEKVKNQVILTY